MPVNGLDHVNVIAADLDETIRFYGEVLGLKVGERPASIDFPGAWLLDAGGRAIIHLMAYDPARHGTDPRSAMPTGSIDHVALACADFAGTVRRCEELGIPHRINDRRHGDLRQVFLTDPNNVTLELNFVGA